uniref:WD repeat-containing protein 91 n=1 Tax=Pygocentrus nattereri TaxID=42514 RepID=A0AAR2KEB3_PYGNA
MASAVERTDDVVREYLIYRGFTSTLKHLDVEIKADKEKGFRVDKIIDQLQQFIQGYDLAGLKEYWSYLDRRLFCRLEDVYRPTVNKLRTSLFRYYLVMVYMVFHIQTFSPYFSRQWADTFLVSLHNFLSVLFQCMTTSIQEENEQLRQILFALQGESKPKKSEEVVHHKLPAYVQHMDRLGDTELRITEGWITGSCVDSEKISLNSVFDLQAVKAKDPTASKDSKMTVTVEPGTGHSRQKRHMDHEKERKELFSKHPQQSSEKKAESSDTETQPECETSDVPSNQARVGGEVGGAGAGPEQPFIKLSQEEYGEHHSSIMHCRVDCSGRRVASLDVDGVVKVWSFNPIMQTKATIMSKSPLLSLEWATKPDRLLLLGSGVGTVRLYDTEAKKNLYEMLIDEAHPRILSLACSPSGTSFVCSAAANMSRPGSITETVPRASLPVSGQLLLWDTKTVKQQLQFALEPGPVAVNCAAFNHNGNLLVTGAADGRIRLFDMQRYESVMSWKAHDGEVYSVEFSYDENTVFSIGEDGKFIQWNIHRSGVKQSEYSLSQDAVGPFVLSGYSGYKQVQVPHGRLFAFDSEGQHVLTCSSTGGLIYRLNKGESGLESVLSLGGHKAPVVTVDWCSAVDCGTCLTASMDGKIKLSTLLAQKP